MLNLPREGASSVRFLKIFLRSREHYVVRVVTLQLCFRASLITSFCFQTLFNFSGEPVKAGCNWYTMLLINLMEWVWIAWNYWHVYLPFSLASWGSGWHQFVWLPGSKRPLLWKHLSAACNSVEASHCLCSGLCSGMGAPSDSPLRIWNLW